MLVMALVYSKVPAKKATVTKNIVNDDLDKKNLCSIVENQSVLWAQAFYSTSYFFVRMFRARNCNQLASSELRLPQLNEN